MSPNVARIDTRNSDRQQRIDLAAAFRWAARLNLHESVANHFSLAVSEDGSKFLMNPNGRHFSRIRASDLLLLDAGDEYGWYCADITRTFPIGADFTPAQRRIHDLVARAHREAVARVRPGVTLEDVHEAAVQVLVEGLLSLGLVQGSPDQVISDGTYRRYYMHRTSHWLGMDVHDVGLYKIAGESRLLEPGMVLTVEPGIYVGNHLTQAPEEWRGIGVRIEDDVLVTPEGHEVLSAAIPKHIAEVEALRRAALAV